MQEPVKPRRRYHSPERNERANATANAVLKAAEALFATRGYAAVTMKQIASAAGIAPATLYLHFASKAAVLGAMAAAITDAPDLSVEHVERAVNAREQARQGARIQRLLNERAWLVSDILKSHAATEPALGLLAAEWRARHLDAVRRGVGALAALGNLRRGLDAGRAADLLFAVAGTDVYRTLVVERGWSPPEYEKWLGEWMHRELVEDGRADETLSASSAAVHSPDASSFRDD